MNVKQARVIETCTWAQIQYTTLTQEMATWMSILIHHLKTNTPSPVNEQHSNNTTTVTTAFIPTKPGLYQHDLFSTKPWYLQQVLISPKLNLTGHSNKTLIFTTGFNFTKTGLNWSSQQKPDIYNRLSIPCLDNRSFQQNPDFKSLTHSLLCVHKSHNYLGQRLWNFISFSF